MKNETNPKIWISLDLEMNKNLETQDVDDIIQIGAVAFDFYSGEIVDKYNAFVKLPQYDPHNRLTVDNFIIKLTGITDQQLDKQGTSLYLAYLGLEDFVIRNNGFRDPVCWGGSDSDYLREQLVLKCGFNEKTHGRYIFNRNFFNAKKDFQIYCQINNLSLRSGLSKSMRRLGLTFKGRIHNALDDSINCKTIFHFLCQKFKEKK